MDRDLILLYASQFDYDLTEVEFNTSPEDVARAAQLPQEWTWASSYRLYNKELNIPMAREIPFAPDFGFFEGAFIKWLNGRLPESEHIDDAPYQGRPKGEITEQEVDEVVRTREANYYTFLYDAAKLDFAWPKEPNDDDQITLESARASALELLEKERVIKHPKEYPDANHFLSSIGSEFKICGDRSLRLSRLENRYWGLLTMELEEPSTDPNFETTVIRCEVACARGPSMRRYNWETSTKKEFEEDLVWNLLVDKFGKIMFHKGTPPELMALAKVFKQYDKFFQDPSNRLGQHKDSWVVSWRVFGQQASKRILPATPPSNLLTLCEPYRQWMAMFAHESSCRLISPQPYHISEGDDEHPGLEEIGDDSEYGYARWFERTLLDPSREYPIVIVHPESGPEWEGLAKEIDSVCREFAKTVPWRHRLDIFSLPLRLTCPPGCVRVYYPGFRCRVFCSHFPILTDSLAENHPLFTADQIKGFSDSGSSIARELFLRFARETSGRVIDLPLLRDVKHERDLCNFEEANQKFDFLLEEKELAEELYLDQEESLLDARKRAEMLRAERFTLDDQISALELVIEQRDDKIRRLELHLDTLLDTLANQQVKVPQEADVGKFRTVKELLRSLRSNSDFSDAIFLTEEALKSSAKVNSRYLQQLEQALASMVEFVKLSWADPAANPMTFFKAKALGFALSETVATEALRKGRNSGMHVKIGTGGDCVRIYFEWDSARKRLVVTHCGSHLPTYTRPT